MKDPKEVLSIRVRASKYASKFLIQKYREEYQELYDAYLRNRGVNTRRQAEPLIDERVANS